MRIFEAILPNLVGEMQVLLLQHAPQIGQEDLRARAPGHALSNHIRVWLSANKHDVLVPDR